MAVNIQKTRAAFDLAATLYDRQFESLPATRRIRWIILHALLKYFRPGDSILEINCGTGTEALSLARHGMKVHATDLSAGMVAETRRKIREKNLQGFVTTAVLGFDDLMKLSGKSFDGAFSSLGGLNCIRNLNDLSKTLSTVIKPGGHFLASVMGRFTLIETLSFLARGKPKSAVRRFGSGGVVADAHGSQIQTFYFSPGAVARAFSDSFAKVQVMGLNIFTPPPTSKGAYALMGRSMRLLERVDDKVARLFPFNCMGDHFLIVLRRKTGV